MDVETRWLGRVPYRAAWQLQHQLVTARAEGTIQDQLLLLEHEPVLTLGRRSDPAHILASPAELAARGIEVVRVERGGEVTYHGPGQLIAYAIVRLADRELLIRPFVRALEEAMIATAVSFGVRSDRRAGYPGVWCAVESARPRKLGALGLRIERGISYHGIAFNVTTDLADYELIDPCGLAGIDVTSVAREAGWPAERSGPSTESVERAATEFARALTTLLLAAPIVPTSPAAVAV